MNVVAVDLAAKFSAVVVTDNYEVQYQWDSWQKPESQFIGYCASLFLGMGAPIPDVLVVEDLPARVPWMTTVKDVCRLQGRIVERMDGYDAIEKILFVQPATWQEHFKIKRGSGPEIVVPVAAEFGYAAPPLEHRCAVSARTGRPLAAETATAKKVATDYCAAYLIGRWAEDQYGKHKTFDAVRTSRYTKA